MGKISKLRLTPTPSNPPQEEGVNADELATLAGEPTKPAKPKSVVTPKPR